MAKFSEGQKATINCPTHFGKIAHYPKVKITRVNGGYIYAMVYVRSGMPFEAEFLENELTPV